ncbi:outer membrane protein assembly factor BamA [Cellvibrio zantedeschiae]|uniref:Outer membrane protein assembly factor BamA n=1 Tax=Cellvibrio zantedeschiae TaxID=1237077 RepID=A0ABQ3ATI4_9GAMM|nr:outer membrane protein assembly factor BamA [Cellvibrio zantedeschiae]
MRFFCCLVVLLTSFAVQAQTQNFRISDIRVEGLQRVSAGTVFSALPVRVGDTVNQSDIQNATRELFKVGFFADVAIQRDGEVLVLVLKERPAINKIELEGNKAIKSENLMDSLKKNNLSEGQIFQRATLEGITQALQREYIAQGRYGATVNIEIEDLPRNQVKVKVKIKEGSVARIKQINIVGNKIFSDQELLDLFELRTSGLFSWISGNDKYSKEKMKGDLEKIESYYMDRGYLAFKLDSSQISLSPDKEQIFITINLTEGDIYTVSSVELAGDPVIDPEILRQFLLVKEGQFFSQILMTTSSEYVTQRLGNEGYTFAKVEGVPEKNDADKTVKMTFFIDPGKRAYVNRINFKGNTKTIDEVLRREMRQMEGGSASTAQIENSKVHLERLGFFKEVKVDTKEVPGSSDKVDVTYTVEEQASGSMSLQIGYAQYSGLLFQAGIQQNNWFGTGKQIGFNFSHNRYQTSYSLNYNDPYFTPDGISRGFSLYYTKSDYGSYNITPYSTNTYGGKITFGYPISEIERIGFDIGLRNLEVTPTGYSSQEIQRTPRFIDGFIYSADQYGRLVKLSDSYISTADYQSILNNQKNGIDYLANTYNLNPVTEDQLGEKGFIDKYGDNFNDAQLSVFWLKSTLNRGVLPDRGAQQRLSGEVTLPVGDLEYFKLDYEGQFFKPLTSALTLRVHGRVGYAETYGKTDRLPFFENFYGGGFGSVRGFERNSLGPRSTVQETPFYAYSTWDDRNGDGKQDDSELSNPALVLCQNANGCSSGTLVVPNGKLLTQREIEDYGRRRGAFGGNVIIEGGAEILFPLPFIKDQRSVQSTLFLDTGNVFDTHCGAQQRNCHGVNIDDFKASFGVGLTWISSFGPMQFSIAKKISKDDPFDDDKVFDFTLGQTF